MKYYFKSMIPILVCSLFLHSYAAAQHLQKIHKNVIGYSDGQFEDVNRHINFMQDQYYEVEKKYISYLIDEEKRIEIVLTPFPKERSILIERFWKGIDALSTESQRSLARKHIKIDSIFPFGAYRHEITIKHENFFAVIEKVMKVERVQGVERPILRSESNRSYPFGLPSTVHRFWDVRGRKAFYFNAENNVNIKPWQYASDRIKPTVDFINSLQLSERQTIKLQEVLDDFFPRYIKLENEHSKVQFVKNGNIRLTYTAFKAERMALVKSCDRKLGKILNNKQRKLFSEAGLLDEYCPHGELTCTYEIIMPVGKKFPYKVESKHGPLSGNFQDLPEALNRSIEFFKKK